MHVRRLEQEGQRDRQQRAADKLDGRGRKGWYVSRELLQIERATREAEQAEREQCHDAVVGIMWYAEHHAREADRDADPLPPAEVLVKQKDPERRGQDWMKGMH